MSADAAVAALLHLGAVVSVLAVAYAKFDKAHGEDDPFDAGLLAVRPKAKEVLLRLGVYDGQKVEFSAKWRLDTRFPACVICLVAGHPVKLGVFKPAHAVYRQRYIPLLGYFSDGNHIFVVSMMAVISVVSFFLLVLASVFSWHWPEYLWIDKTLCVWLIGFAIWIFLTSAAAAKLQKDKLDELCEDLEKLITKRFEALLQRARKAQAKLAKILESLGDGKPPAVQA